MYRSVSRVVEETVIIFYSSSIQPGIIDSYADAIHALETDNRSFRIVDIETDKELAKQYNVVTTPTVVVEKEDSIRRHPGMIEGVEEILHE